MEADLFGLVHSIRKRYASKSTSHAKNVSGVLKFEPSDGVVGDCEMLDTFRVGGLAKPVAEPYGRLPLSIAGRIPLSPRSRCKVAPAQRLNQLTAKVFVLAAPVSLALIPASPIMGVLTVFGSWVNFVTKRPKFMASHLLVSAALGARLAQRVAVFRAKTGTSHLLVSAALGARLAQRVAVFRAKTGTRLGNRWSSPKFLVK
mmetsp:Transcript_5485/g.15868  ORF Transcript_5485/g.15868 Transcript_5485/m.15868 type:complete len:202 (-) Transcript_5485:1935-2540(-)